MTNQFKPTEQTAAILNGLVACLTTAGNESAKLNLIHLKACQVQQATISKADIESVIKMDYPRQRASDVNVLARDILAKKPYCGYTFQEFTNPALEADTENNIEAFTPSTISSAVTCIRAARKVLSDEKDMAKKNAQWDIDAAKAYVSSDEKQVDGAVNDTILLAMAQTDVPEALEAIELGKCMVPSPFDKVTDNQKALTNAMKAVKAIMAEGTMAEMVSLNEFNTDYVAVCDAYDKAIAQSESESESESESDTAVAA